MALQMTLGNSGDCGSASRTGDCGTDGRTERAGNVRAIVGRVGQVRRVGEVRLVKM